jgi:hypothetical protein
MTPKKCGKLPGAGLPKLALLGLALYQATSSWMLFAGWLALTESELEVADLCDRREVGDRVVRQLREHQRREHRNDDRRQHQHAAVGGRILDRLGDDPAARAGAVLNHHRLLQLVLHAVGDQPRGDVGRAAGGEADEQPHRLVDLGEGWQRHAGKHGGAGEG